MRIYIRSLVLLTSLFVYFLAAEETILIESSLTSTSITGLITGGSIKSSKTKLAVRLSVDGALSGANFRTVTLDAPFSTWRLATALSGSTVPTSYATGPHTITLSVVEFGTTSPILSSATDIMTVETARPHIWLDAIGPSGATFPVEDTSLDYFLFNTDRVITPAGTLLPSAAPPDLKRLTVTLLDNPAGSSEFLSTALTTVAGLTGYTVNAYSPATRQLTIVATTSLPGSTAEGWLRSIIYRYNNSSNPIVGTRRVAFQVTTTAGLSSDQCIASISVKSGLPIVALTGTEGVTPATVFYNEGVGDELVFPNAIIINQSPLYQNLSSLSPVLTHSQEPAYLYRVEPSGAIVQLNRLQILDDIAITLENPDGTGLFDAATEFISFKNVPAPGTFVVYDLPGNYFFYDGTYNPSSPTGSGLSYFSFQDVLSDPAAGVRRRSLTSAQSSGQAAQNPVFFPSQQGKTPAELSVFQYLLQNVTYTNLSNNLVANGTRRTIKVTATNLSTTSLIGGAVSSALPSASIELQLRPENKAPNFSIPVGGFSMNQTNSLNNNPLFLNGIIVSDIDGNSGQEWLTLSVPIGTLQMPSSPVTGSVSSPDGGKTLIIKGTVNDLTGTLQSALSITGNLRYIPPLGAAGDVTVSVSFDDRGNSSTGTPTPRITTTTFIISMTKSNQPPTVDVPILRIADENSERVFTGVAISDEDLTSTSSSPMLVQVSSSQGTVSLATIDNLDFSTSQPDGEGGGLGDGDADAVVRFRGLPSDVTDAIKALTYRPNPNYYGDDSISILANDLGGIGIRPVGYVILPSVTASLVPGSSAWITTDQFPVDVRFINQMPQATTYSVNLPIGGTVIIKGGDYVSPTNYPPGILGTPVSRLSDAYVAVSPTESGTSVIPGVSNLVATDVETKQASGLIFTVNLPVSQGILRLSRPSSVVDLVAGETFTQDDLNRDYVSYIHNGALSGNDGFVFTVHDDNAITCPSRYSASQVNGVSSQQIFSLNINRIKPIAIFNGSTTPSYTEGTAAVLIDSDPLTRVINATEPTNFVLVGSTGQLTATVTIPTQLGVNPGTTSSDPQDSLTLLDQPPLGFTGQQMFYNGSPIGSYSGGNGTPLVVTFSSALPVSVAAVSETLRHIQFSNPAANLSASDRVITVTVLNGAGQVSVVASKTVRVVPVNNAPVITPPSQQLLTVPGLTVGGTVQSADPDGVLSFALTGSPPTRGLVTVNAATGAFTYNPAPNPNGAGGVLTDQFEVTASDPGIPADGTVKTTSQIYQIRVTDLGAVAPVFTTNPPLEAALGRVLTYVPQVSTNGLTAPNLRYSLLGLSPAVTPGLGFDPVTGTVTWPSGWSVSPVPTADSYQQLGLLVVDQANQVAAYQPIMLKILLIPRASN